MSELTISRTTTDDIAALQDVLNQMELFPAEMLPDMLAPALAGQDDALWLTCHQEKKAIGFCFTTPEQLADGTWNMLALAVHPDRQGGGVGSALVRATEKALTDRNQRILIVETSSTDAFAETRRFYGRNGYEEEARIRDFWAGGDDKVVFRKAL